MLGERPAAPRWYKVLMAIATTNPATGEIEKTFEALSDDVSSDRILRTIIDRVPVPVVPLRADDRVRVGA